MLQHHIPLQAHHSKQTLLSFIPCLTLTLTARTMRGGRWTRSMRWSMDWVHKSSPPWTWVHVLYTLYLVCYSGQPECHSAVCICCTPIFGRSFWSKRPKRSFSKIPRCSRCCDSDFFQIKGNFIHQMSAMFTSDSGLVGNVVDKTCMIKQLPSFSGL